MNFDTSFPIDLLYEDPTNCQHNTNNNILDNNILASLQQYLQLVWLSKGFHTDMNTSMKPYEEKNEATTNDFNNSRNLLATTLSSSFLISLQSELEVRRTET